MVTFKQLRKAVNKALGLKGSVRDQVEAAVEHNVQRALNSPYDFKVAVMAIGSASGVIDSINKESLCDDDYLDAIINKLTLLKNGYYNEAGEYTSGKGEIGSLLFDVKRIKEDREYN